MNEYLVFTSEYEAILVEQKISENMGFPTANTLRWADVRKAYNDTLWYFIAPAKQFLAGIDINFQTVTNIDTFIEPFEIDLG